jgi:ribosomal protein L37E
VTVAICIRCGEKKFGAWVGCPACGFEPESGIDKAKSVLASDHYFSPQYLEGAAEQLRQGRPLVFLEEQVTSLARGIERQDYFFMNFDFESGTIRCMRCGMSFQPDGEKEDVICPLCYKEP